jgi:lysophospholipase L1-like esterase
MRSIRLLRFAMIAAVALVRPVAAQTPAGTGRFEAEIRAYEARDREAPPAAGAVLFVGSSSIRLWCTLDRDFPSLRVLNRGFGGSEMGEVAQYAERIVFPYRPRTIVLYAGDNDLAAGRTPAEVHDAFARFASLVHARLPEARLVYLAIKPSVARVKLLPEMRAANALVRADARREPWITYVDVFTPMLGPRGAPKPDLFGPDGLHMNSAGYALWRAILLPVLAR